MEDMKRLSIQVVVLGYDAMDFLDDVVGISFQDCYVWG
jgi:hypothetical protein